MGVHNDAQDLRLESFQNFNAGGGISAPELYTVGPGMKCLSFTVSRSILGSHAVSYLISMVRYFSGGKAIQT
jgi:hypothetical protein